MPSGVVRKVNGSAARILRRGAEELVGRELDELFPGRNRWVVNSLAKVREFRPHRHHHRHRPCHRRQ
jgi:hypothetical protein